MYTVVGWVLAVLGLLAVLGEGWIILLLASLAFAVLAAAALAFTAREALLLVRHWREAGRQQREAEEACRREERVAIEAREVRRCRPCEAMDRATLVEQVAEFAPRNWLQGPVSRDPTRLRPPWDRRVILVGMDTATLRAMCGTIRANAAWSGCLPGEVPAGWSVYRIRFADGAAYVGQTHHRVVWRLAQHLSGDGSPRVLQRRNAGVAYRIDVLASGLLTERVAQRIERAEIAKLAKPLKLSGPVHRWSDPVEIATAKANTAALSLSLETLARYVRQRGAAP